MYVLLFIGVLFVFGMILISVSRGPSTTNSGTYAPPPARGGWQSSGRSNSTWDNDAFLAQHHAASERQRQENEAFFADHRAGQAEARRNRELATEQRRAADNQRWDDHVKAYAEKRGGWVDLNSDAERVRRWEEYDRATRIGSN